ncbi:hypothetical protein ACLEIY_06765 [Acetobacter tropicalis]|uniref:hypothetical protein n=1 Tax=Acetobacter TaxID=434 RepID=UPI001EDB71E3|nr:hypothetical protein [Acetobacter senegalensis]
MSGTNTSSGTPISALPLASSVSSTDTVIGVVTSGGTTEASQISIDTLASGISSAIGLDDAVSAADASAAKAAASQDMAGQAATDALNTKIGKAGGAAALDSNGHLALTDGTSRVSVLTVTPATDTAPALLTPDVPLDAATKVGSTGLTLADMLARENQLPSGTYYVDQNDVVRLARQVGELPDDVSLNGNVYVAGATALPTGLTSNGGVIMTDGTIYFPNTWNNNGVLCAAGA